MKTDVDTCLKEIADWFVKNRRTMKEPELRAILVKHCESEQEVRKFIDFLETEPGQLRFRTLLGERRGVMVIPPSLQVKHFWVEQNIPYETWAVVEAFPGGTVRTPFNTKEEAIKREEEIVAYYEWNVKQVPSPREKFPRQHEALKKLYPYEFVEYHDGDLTIQLLVPRPKPQVGFNKGVVVVVTTDGRTFKESDKASYLKEELAETECQIISPQYYDILTWLNVPVPDYSFAIEPEAKERKIDEVLEKLKDGVARIHESAIFREFLTTMAKFWEYSIGNQILIMLQKPGATRVAGYNTWRDLGRFVKRGERGIAILAPCLPPRLLKCPLCERVFTERELRTHIPQAHPWADVSETVRRAKEEMEAVVPTPTYFKVVYVFDVSQTEGKPLPEIAVPVLTGAFSEDLNNRLMKLSGKYSLTVSFEPRPEQDPEIKGMLLAKVIWVKPDEPPAQRLKTLAHEEAHYFTESVYFIPRADAEVIAESVAFVVGAHFGFDSGIRTFPYVALWAKEKKVLEQNLASIRKISGRMIEELG